MNLRCFLKAKVIDNDEIQQRLNCSLPEVKQYLMSLYESDYATFFVSLIDVEGFLKVDRYLYKHYRSVGHFYYGSAFPIQGLFTIKYY